MSGPESRALAKVDAFATEAVSRLAPLTLGVARSPDELAAVYRLRYEVVIDHGWARADEFHDGLERDEFDERALQIVAWADDVLVGTTRLVAPKAGCRLPTEQVFDLEIAGRARVIDMGRTCRTPCCKDRDHRIVWGVLCQAWLELRRLGFAEICGIFSPGMMRFYQRLGMRVEILGAARAHWGERRFPVLVRPADTIDAVRSKSKVDSVCV